MIKTVTKLLKEKDYVNSPLLHSFRDALPGFLSLKAGDFYGVVM
jgi:hypothetical protein